MPTTPSSDPCILEGVRPFLTELQTPVSLQVVSPDHALRPTVEGFIQGVFQRAYGAELQRFYPTLLSFRDAERQRAAVGYRDGTIRPLFSEQYLPQPADTLIGEQLGESIPRERLVEVGNLALGGAGEARWVIAAVTLFLYELGYRWVLFTAVKPLFNAFQRLGLNPLPLAEADADRLPDKGASWGRYYEARPVVCAGNIASGYRQLRRREGQHPPMLRHLLEQVSREAALGRALPHIRHGGL